MADSLARLREATRDRYLPERELGRGGMACVYLARDLRHRRAVAIKVLHPELSAALGPERFLREIEIAAGLTHPHILPLFDSGEGEGVLYYVMPYVEGESLRDRLRRERQLPLADALRIAREVGDALAYAHARGVVHRDIKPENILLEGGHAVVSDFGVARALSAAGADRLTSTGLAIGTPAYMSPEQATGAEEVDGRADIYALGCVLYEMLVGEPPFTGPTPQAVIARRLAGQVPSVVEVREGVPPEVESALRRALARVPADRFPRAEQFAAALETAAEPTTRILTQATRRPRTRMKSRAGLALAVAVVLALVGSFARVRARSAVAPVNANSIAVLPFRVSDPALAAYREGLVDYYSSALDGPGGLRAVGARSTLKRWYARVGSAGEGDDEAIPEVARDLGARFALTGAVIPLGSGVRLTAVVRDVVTDTAIRAQADGPADSIAALAARVGAELLRRIAGPESRLVTVGAFATGSLEALKAYLSGERAFRAALYRDAQAAFDQAIALDSNFALPQFRRGAATGWTRSPHDPGPVPELVLARLPLLGRRDSLMVRGSWELSKSLRAALVSFQVLTREYPDDPEAWYLLGDAYYHIGMLHGVPPAAVDSAFRRAIALDSAFAPAYLHLVENAFERTDSVESGVLIRALARFDSTSSKTIGLGLAWALAFGTEHERLQSRERLSALSADALLPAKHALNLNPDLAEWTATVGRSIYENPANDRFARVQGLAGWALSLGFRGRFREQWDVYLRAQVLWDSSGASWEAGLTELLPAIHRVEGLPAYEGWHALPSPARFARYDPARSNDPNGLFLSGLWGIARGRWDLATQAAAALRGIADTLGPGGSFAEELTRREDRPWIRHLAEELDRWKDWVGSPTPQTLRRFEDATDSLRNYDTWATLADFVLGKTYFELGDLARAERHMLSPQRWRSGNEAELIPPREYYLGRIAEERGNRAEAREHYTRFVRWWRDCDPELRPWWEEAREALARLTDEPREGATAQ